MSKSQTLAIITNVLFVTQIPQHPCSMVNYMYLDANILRLTSCVTVGQYESSDE